MIWSNDMPTLEPADIPFLSDAIVEAAIRRIRPEWFENIPPVTRDQRTPTENFPDYGYNGASV